MKFAWLKPAARVDIHHQQKQSKPRAKKFLNSGGEVVDQALLTPVQIVDIYFELYAKRWGMNPETSVK